MSQTDFQTGWRKSRNALVSAVVALGFPEELGNEIVKNLGSPKAMNRMLAYLNNVKPKKAELIVDEMLAIRTEIEAWRERKESLKANARYNEMMLSGFDEDAGEDW